MRLVSGAESAGEVGGEEGGGGEVKELGFGGRGGGGRGGVEAAKKGRDGEGAGGSAREVGLDIKERAVKSSVNHPGE